MQLLLDAELKECVKNGTIDNVPIPASWDDRNSPVQPASIDLHVGNIYIPGKAQNEPGGTGMPESDLVLRTGQTAVVSTLETLNFPKNLCAIGFPPSHVSELGLLMTNPGHVDPGYSGPLRFTVINMGKEDFSLRRADVLFTLLVLRVDGTPTADWMTRNKQAGTLPIQGKINRLGRDFINLEGRARRIALETAAVASILAGVLGVFLTIGANMWIDRFSGLQDLRGRVVALETQVQFLRDRPESTRQPDANAQKGAADGAEPDRRGSKKK